MMRRMLYPLVVKYGARMCDKYNIPVHKATLGEFVYYLKNGSDPTQV